MFTTQKVPMISLKFVCHYLNVATPDYEEANSMDNACEEEDDAFCVLLAAMSPYSLEVEEEEITTKDSSDDEISENDEEYYQEHDHDVDSVVLPVAIEDLLLFPAIALICLMNYLEFVKDVSNAICIAEFEYRLFALMNSNIKKCLCKAI